MLHSLKADFYRLFKSPGFYITLIVLTLYQGMTVWFEAIGHIGMESDQAAQNQARFQDMTWTADVAAQAMSNMSSLMIYFGLPLFVMIIGYDTSRQTYKNILTMGVTRLQYFISKIVVFVVALFLELVFYYGIGMLIAGFRHGWGQINMDFWQDFSQIFAVEFLNILAIFAVATLILYWFFSNVGAVISTIVLPLITTVVITLSQIEWLAPFSFQAATDLAWQLDWSQDFWTQNLLATIGTIIVVNGLAYWVFRQKSL